MLLSRDDLVSVLFSETDRAQRLKLPLTLIHIGLADCPNLKSARSKPRHEATISSIVERFSRVLRCYDSVGQIADREFVLILPGCRLFNAKMLAERLRDEVFGLPFGDCGEEMQLNACFGVVSSGGRSALVVLREAERALQRARTTEPSLIHCFGSEDELDPAVFLMPVLEDGSLHW
ncbi:MAG: GGDEF domain-containing protein [Terracidiphilus sp.]